MTPEKQHLLADALAEFLDPYPADDPAVTPDYLITKCEALGLGWSLDHTGGMIEARVWDWPWVKGRHRPQNLEPLAKMLWSALADAQKHIAAGTNA
jgi:hypothetical protein